MKRVTISKCIILLAALSFGVCNAQATYYVSDIVGDDANIGSEAAPFKTIQKAADTMQSGDTCLIKQGVYRESVTPPTSGVTFKNYQNDYVLVTGLDVVEGGWSKYRNGIHQAPFSDEITEVFVNGRHMSWARYPNEDGNRLSKRDMTTVQMVPIKKESLEGTAILHDVEDKPDDFWKGGYVLGVSDDIPWWSSLHGKIKSSTGNELTCEEVCFLWWQSANSFGKGYGTGYVIGALGALDSANEWVWQDGKLYFQPEADQKMEDLLVEGRTRVFAFNLTDKSNITIDGLHIKAANIILPDSTDCVIKNCNLKYPGSFSTYFIEDYGTKQRAAWGDFEYSGAAISVGGERNTIENCYVGYTWTTGISLYGNFNTARNNYVEEANWMGERMSLLSNIGDDNKVLNNTLKRCARDGIEMGHAQFTQDVKGTNAGYAKRATIKNNYIKDVAYFCPDSGSLYVNHSAGYYPLEDGIALFPLANTEISYNIMDGYHSPIYYSGHGGIYLDNGSSGYTIHHNVIMNSQTGVNNNNIKVKHRPNHNFVFNNTFINVNEAVRLNTQSGAAESEENQAATQLVAKNNLATHANAHFVATKTAKNIKINVNKLVDAENGDFQLTSAATSAIDKGVVIEDPVWPEGITGVTGISDGYVGSAPDIGAFEYGAQPWTAGATIDLPVFIDELGFIDELINGETLVQTEIDAAVAAKEAKEALVYEQRWQSNNEDNWTLTDFSAYSQATKNSLYSGGGGIAYRKILDVTPGVLHKATFNYTFSNKSGKTGAGVRICVHEGDSPDANNPSLGYKEFTTTADVSEPEDGTGSFDFTPTTDTVYVIFYKIGRSSDTAKAKVEKLDIEMVNQAPVFTPQSGDSKVATFNRAGAASGDANYVSTINGVTMTITPESNLTDPDTIGVLNAHLGVTGGKNDQTVNDDEKLLISFDQPVLLQSVNIGSIGVGESAYLSSTDFDGLTAITGVDSYDDNLNRLTKTEGDFIDLDDSHVYSGILLGANSPIEMTTNAGGSISYNGITVSSLKIAHSEVKESLPVGSTVATVSATDPNTNDRLTYAVVGGNTDNAFEIDSYSGEITVKNALDYETINDYTLTVTVTDNGVPAMNDFATVNISVIEDNTPDIGLEVSLNKGFLVWSVDDERFVTEFKIMVDNQLFDTVLAENNQFYIIDDIDPDALKVELIVVYKSNYTKTHTPSSEVVTTEFYDLQDGWNLLGVTLSNTNLDMLRHDASGPIWGWNGSVYHTTDSANATDAIWVFSSGEKDTYVVGNKSEEAIELSLGWNMVTPTVVSNIPEQAHTVYFWDNPYKKVKNSELLEPGKGYWIFCLNE